MQPFTSNQAHVQMRKVAGLRRLMLALILSCGVWVLTPQIANAQFDCAAVTDISVAECEALVTIYNSMDGPNWYIQDNWLVTTTACSWYGVICDPSTGHVIALEADGGPQGAVPPDIEKLSYLERLFLSPGVTSVPPEIGNLSNLERLIFNVNKLTTLPPEIGNLANLHSLDLSENQISSLPPEIGDLSNLQHLNLLGNQLSSLPAEIGNLSSLVGLAIGFNQLSSLPAEMGNLSNLQSLTAPRNELSSLPIEMGNLTNLTNLQISDNKLSHVPEAIGNMVNLERLSINSNPDLFGPLPDFLLQLMNLEQFSFSLTRLCVPDDAVFQDWLNGIDRVSGTGEICSDDPLPPFACSNVTEIPLTECEALEAFYDSTGGLLTWEEDAGWDTTATPCSWYGITCTPEPAPRHVIAIELPQNNLRGAIPPEISNLTHLQRLDIHDHFIRSLPAEIGDLTSLEHLDVGSALEGLTWPNTIFNLTNLKYLSLSGTYLNAFPAEIGNLVELRQLDLSGNQITSLPVEIGDLVNLQHLDLSSNWLDALPAEIGNLSRLQTLYLYYNRLTSLPMEIGNLPNLETLHLYSNQLSTLPPEIGSFTNLTMLHLGSNQLTMLPPEIGNLTNLTQMDLASNQLTMLPSEIGNLTKLTKLFLWSNRLATLPSGIFNFTDLTELSIAGNLLTVLPPEIGNLTNLTQLDLGSNQINLLPSEIGNLLNLKELSLHGNRSLSGPLPDFLLQLTKLEQFSYGQTRLCLPETAAFQSWINSIDRVSTNARICSGGSPSPQPPDASSPLHLSYFTSESETSGVTLRWETEVEADNLGFNIYRISDGDDAATQVNGELIPAQGTAETGATYELVDHPASGNYVYVIKNVDQQGMEHLRGQVEVEAVTEVTVGEYSFFLPALAAP